MTFKSSFTEKNELWVSFIELDIYESVFGLKNFHRCLCSQKIWNVTSQGNWKFCSQKMPVNEIFSQMFVLPSSLTSLTFCESLPTKNTKIVVSPSSFTRVGLVTHSSFIEGSLTTKNTASEHFMSLKNESYFIRLTRTMSPESLSIHHHHFVIDI